MLVSSFLILNFCLFFFSSGFFSSFFFMVFLFFFLSQFLSLLFFLHALSLLFSSCYFSSLFFVFLFPVFFSFLAGELRARLPVEVGRRETSKAPSCSSASVTYVAESNGERASKRQCGEPPVSPPRVTRSLPSFERFLPPRRATPTPAQPNIPYAQASPGVPLRELEIRHSIRCNRPRLGSLFSPLFTPRLACSLLYFELLNFSLFFSPSLVTLFLTILSFFFFFKVSFSIIRSLSSSRI